MRQAHMKKDVRRIMNVSDKVMNRHKCKFKRDIQLLRRFLKSPEKESDIKLCGYN